LYSYDIGLLKRSRPKKVLCNRRLEKRGLFGDFPLPIFDAVLYARTVRGSIIDTRTRMDLQESLAFAVEGKRLLQVHCAPDALNNINGIFERIKVGDIVKEESARRRRAPPDHAT
jgi:hypothetical protein